MKGLKRILLPAFTLITLTSCGGMNGGNGLFKYESQENDTIDIKNGDSSMYCVDATFLQDGTEVSDEEVAKNGKKLDLFIDCSWVFEQTSEDVYKFTITILSDWHKEQTAWGDQKVISRTFKAVDDFTYSIITMKDNELIEDEDDNKTFENLQNAVIDHDKIFEQIQDEYFVLTYAKDVEYKDTFLKTVEKYATSNKIPVYLVAFDNNDSIGETVGAEHFDSSVATSLEQVGVRSYDDFKYTDTPVLYRFESKEETVESETEPTVYKEITEAIYGQDKIVNYINELSPVFG